MVKWSQEAKKRGYSNAKEMLLSLYVRRQLSASEIGGTFGTTAQSIRNALRKYGIPLRTRGGAH